MSILRERKKEILIRAILRNAARAIYVELILRKQERMRCRMKEEFIARARKGEGLRLAL